MNKIVSKVVQIFSIPDLRKKIFIVLALLIVFRLFAAVPVPGIDVSRLKAIFSSNQLLGILNIFSGGTLDNLSIVMLGVGPYITATIIMQLLTMIFPKMKEMYYEEGEAGRMKFNQISRYITIPLSLVQAYAYLNILISQKVLDALTLPVMAKDIVLITAGTMLIMWIGELISEYKIGNGISLIIFAGIISGIPNAVRNAVLSYQPSMLPGYLAFLVVTIVIVAGVVIINEAERKVPVSYAKRVRGNRMFGGVSTYLPLKVNQAGVIPIIFAISIMLFPQFIGQIFAVIKAPWALSVSSFLIKLFENQIVYSGLYFVLVLLFTYFYTMVTFDPKEISQNLQKNGGFVPGVRPGQPTATFLSQVLNRITLVGALFLGLIAVFPSLMKMVTDNAALTIGGTSVLIVVSVALETAKQIESQLVMREYEGF
jgi:preprotein translocase subunit SecY